MALIFDFDDTLAPDTTSSLLQEYGINPNVFWKKEVKKLVLSGYDPAHAYLNLLIKNIGKDKPFGELTNGDLADFGKNKINKLFYSGLPKLFEDLTKIAKRTGMEIKFFVISGGLQEIIEGCGIIQDYFTAVYGCQLAGDKDSGILKYIKRCVTFTEKTRYLFEINKGIDPKDTIKNPYLVNKNIPEKSRPIPFKNMIYVGDGLTDIPCFSLIKNNGGLPFGVFDPAKKKSAKTALIQFLKTSRVISSHSPKYGKKDELGSFIRAAVAERCAQVKLKRVQAESE
ncbi:MAG TPA: HAD family hydrolase [Thermodesulfobacteriota bacterium]|nr:HAD family hydrolase [Thermodesulfobacteriota bacterium]